MYLPTSENFKIIACPCRLLELGKKGLSFSYEYEFIDYLKYMNFPIEDLYKYAHKLSSI